MTKSRCVGRDLTMKALIWNFGGVDIDRDTDLLFDFLYKTLNDSS
ncbi:hypothetical protein SDC9_208995 [bioreactor metagenome]|uniref:Uncharacterized protein n=1 Tax=bioreactor metagenome TaxID=1076179 RepID=A0A645JDV0_9ZZZZ